MVSTRASTAAVDRDPIAREALRVVTELVPGFRPTLCELLKRGKSEVFAVRGALGHPALVAKCASGDTISVELRVASWLAAAPFPTVRAWGTTAAQEPGRAWLISEYAMGEPYHRNSASHRRIAGAWMADLHVWSASVVAPDLPARDSAYHRQIVRAACATLAEALEVSRDLTVHDRSTVRVLHEIGLSVLDGWHQVDSVISALPATIVHSGISGKNLRVNAEPGHAVVLAFDWEQAGWGCPAADLSMVDLPTYRTHAQRGGIGLPDTPLVGAVGAILWCLAAIPGERPNLVSSWPHRAAGKLTAYLDQIRSAMIVLDGNALS